MIGKQHIDPSAEVVVTSDSWGIGRGRWELGSVLKSLSHSIQPHGAIPSAAQTEVTTTVQRIVVTSRLLPRSSGLGPEERHDTDLSALRVARGRAPSCIARLGCLPHRAGDEPHEPRYPLSQWASRRGNGSGYTSRPESEGEKAWRSTE